MERLKVINLDSDEKILFFDGSAIQNPVNTSKTIFKHGTKNRCKRNPMKFKINALGSLALRGNSHLTITNSSKAHEISKAFIEIKIANTDNYNLIKLLKNVLKSFDLSDDELKEILSYKNSTLENFIEKIIKNINNAKTDSEALATTIEKNCKKERTDNIKRLDTLKRKILLKHIDSEEIHLESHKDPIIHIILDNYVVHKSKIVEKICDILNINLIYLPKYSPNLNPIEQAWRTCKNYINKYHYVNLNELEEYFLKIFYEVLNKGNFTKEWENKFLKKVK